MNNITITKTEDYQSVYLYLIDGVQYQQKGFSTEKEAMAAGMAKVKELEKEEERKAQNQAAKK